jgi:hypothetical protein
MVEPGERAPGEPGRPEEPGSSPELMPGLRSGESPASELIPVAPGAGIETSCPDRPEEPGASLNSPTTESVLAQFGAVAERPQAQPLSVVHADRIPIELPKQFGRYRILEKLGKGAMGAIYLAHDTQLDRRVALKVPHLLNQEAGAAPDQCDLDRFYREARGAANLDHPNLCPVYDVGQIEGIPYLTMAYIKGRPLTKYIRRDRPMSQRRAAIIVRKLAQALEEAHYNGVVHRDLKPSNIMVNGRGDVIVMDFGLAWRIGSQDKRLTRIGLVVGTPVYMSPEQACGKLEDMGPGCDIYSLGVILYELLTGRVPFEGPEALVLGQILFIEPALPSTYRGDLDPGLESICLKAIAKRRDQRYATMGELAMALGDYLRSATGASPLFDGCPRGAAPGVAEDGHPEAVEEPTAELSPPPVAIEEVESVDPELPIAVPETGILWKAWREWTAIVEHFTVRPFSVRVNRCQYETLYKLLLGACRDRAAKAMGPRREFYLRLADFVLPWMTPKALRSTDREILYSVLWYCRQFEQELLDQTELPPEPEAGTWSRWWLGIGLLVASFVITLIRIYWAS